MYQVSDEFTSDLAAVWRGLAGSNDSQRKIVLRLEFSLDVQDWGHVIDLP